MELNIIINNKKYRREGENIIETFYVFLPYPFGHYIYCNNHIFIVIAVIQSIIPDMITYKVKCFM